MKCDLHSFKECWAFIVVFKKYICGFRALDIDQRLLSVF